jgi:hypothetical protein
VQTLLFLSKPALHYRVSFCFSTTAETRRGKKREGRGPAQTWQALSTSTSFEPQVGMTAVHEEAEPPEEVVPGGQAAQLPSMR